MTKKTVRILRTLPVEGIIYRANDLVTFDDKVLAGVDQRGYDAEKSAVDYCKSLGGKVIEHGKPSAPMKPAAPGSGAEGEGGLVE